MRLTLGPYYSDPSHPPIEDIAMAGLKSLYAPNKGIHDLTGLEYAVNLMGLTVFGNDIRSLSPISGLTGLKSLKIHENPISDLAPLAGLTNLELLWVGDNLVRDFDVIGGLVNLTELALYQLDELWHIAFVEPLTKLTKLTVEACPNVSDLAPIEQLPALKMVNLENNGIELITPLVSNMSLETNRASIYLGGNPLSQYCVCREVPVLVSRGISVYGAGVCRGAIDFDDEDLAAEVGEAVGITEREIYTDEVVGVGFTTLHMDGTPLSGLGGLEWCTDLVDLGLSHGGITGIAELHTLTDLTQLALNGNAISDVDPLGYLTALTYLNLDENALSDTVGLEKLPNLTTLSVHGNQFSRLNAFGLLVHLRYLNIGNNQLTFTGLYDGDALANLTQLHELYLRDNQITDLTPLLNSALGEADVVYLQGNPLSHTALTVQIPALQARGVIVHYDGSVPEAIAFADPRLEAKVLAAIGKPAGPVYVEDVVGTGFVSLSASASGIVALGGLDRCRDLRTLDLSGNAIKDLGPLGGLTKLDELDLCQNEIVDIAPLASLTTLTQLNLADNAIVDVSPLEGLTNLVELWLAYNAVSDVQPLAGLFQLTHLTLTSNGLMELSALANLVNLVSFEADGNHIKDLGPLSGLTNLEQISLALNRVVTVTALAPLVNIKELGLYGNQIEDIAVLLDNAGLAGEEDYVDLAGNPLNQYALCLVIPELEKRGVSVERDGHCGAEGEGEGEDDDKYGCTGGSAHGSDRGSRGNLFMLSFVLLLMFSIASRSKAARR